MILEKALIKYTKDERYDYTIESKYIEFENEEKALEYAKTNLEKDTEYYFYETKEDVENNEHYDVIICNELI